MQGVGVHSGCNVHMTARAGLVVCSTLVHAYQSVGKPREKIRLFWDGPTRG